MTPTDHRKDGTFRRRNKARLLPDSERRVVLPAQRVAPETLARLREIAPQHGGIGRTIDALTAPNYLFRRAATEIPPDDTPTPETDGNTHHLVEDQGILSMQRYDNGQWVPASFARSLERRLRARLSKP